MSAHELSLCSTGGLTQPQTMKLRGKVLGLEVIVLIDSIANHNFVPTRLVQVAGWKVEPTPPYSVRLGDGNKKETKGCCKKLALQIGDMEVREDFFLFELEGVDLILEVAWLV